MIVITIYYKYTKCVNSCQILLKKIQDSFLACFLKRKVTEITVNLQYSVIKVFLLWSL